MPNLTLPTGAPGIRSLLVTFPDTSAPLMALAQAVLRGPSSLDEAERELLAAAVSAENGCRFCALSHGAAARVLLGDRAWWVDRVFEGGPLDFLPAKTAALVTLARAVARSPHGAAPGPWEEARREGASDRDLHDTVLVAATFSLFNRYVDGLGAPEPSDTGAYAAMGHRLARDGYH